MTSESEPPVSIASPERQWRAAASPLIAGTAGWILAGSLHLDLRSAPPTPLPTAATVSVISGAVAIGLALAVLIMRTRLVLTHEGIADHRLFRVTRMPWGLIARFEIGRPHGLWGGFCIQAVCRNGEQVDLMSTRAYSRVPSAGHLDELHRISWTLEGRLTSAGEAAGGRAEPVS